MNGAQDYVTKVFVPANQPGAKNRRCICVECGAPVSHAGGAYSIMVAHFRHKANHPKSRKCKLYIAGIYGDAHREYSRRARLLAEPRLCVALKPSAGTGKWFLSLQMPRFVDAKRLRIGYYSPNPGWREVDEIEPEGSFIPVYPRVEPYEFELELRGVGIETRKITGLGKISCFRMGYTHGTQLLDDEPLAWGQTYVIVHPRRTKLADVPSSVITKSLDENEGWSAKIVGLPARPDGHVSAWSVGTLGRKVASPAHSLTLLSPIGSRLTASNVWHVSERHDDIVIGIRCGDASTRSISIAERSSTGDERQHTLQLRDAVGTLRLGKRQNGLYEFHISGESSQPLQLRIHAEAGYIPVARFVLAFDNATSRLNHTLWDQDLPKMFDRVRSREFRLVEARMPERGKVRIITRRKGESTERNFEYRNPQERDLAALALVKFLHELLTDPQAAFEIDAYGFGSLSFPLEKVAPAKPRPGALSPLAQAQRQWIRLAGGSSVSRSTSFVRRSDPRIRFVAHLNQTSR